MLGTLLVLALIAGAVIRGSSEDWKAASNALAAAEAQALAEAGIMTVVHAIATRTARTEIPIDGTPFEIEYHGTKIRLHVQDEFGQIDLNAAGDELIRAALLTVGLDVDQANRVTDAIADWRDADDLKRLNGAERDEYLAVGRRSGPRNGPFESVAELEQVPGMTREILVKLASVFTVQSGRAFVDPGAAPRGVLAVLLRGRPQEIGPTLQARAEARPTAGTVTDLAGRAFTIDAAVEASRNGHARLAAIIRFTGDPGRPYLVHEWRRDRSHPRAHEE